MIDETSDARPATVLCGLFEVRALTPEAAQNGSTYAYVWVASATDTPEVLEARAAERLRPRGVEIVAMHELHAPATNDTKLRPLIEAARANPTTCSHTSFIWFPPDAPA